MHLLHQRGPLHDLPDTPEAYDAVLADVTEQALARLTPAGSLEHPDCLDDIGDTSLGITSLLALAWRRTKDPRLPEAVHRSLAFHLRERVYRDDNPGYPNLRIRDSGFPYARYVLEAGAHPSATGRARCGRCSRRSTCSTRRTAWSTTTGARSCWRWHGLLALADRGDLLQSAGGGQPGHRLRGGRLDAGASSAAGGGAVGRLAGDRPVRRRDPRPSRAGPRRAAAPEHGGAYDNNYGPISLSFLAQAHRVSGEEIFAEDGDALARYIDARLTGGGFDNGGPRYSEQHSGFESVLGLRYFGARIGSDLGRYRGDTRWGRHAVKPDGGVDGHFAWMLVWQIQDATRWHRTPSPAPARHQLRAGSASVAFDDRMTPSLVEAGGTYYLPAAVNRQHGFGPVTDGFLLCRPMGEVRVRDARADGLTAKLVTKPVVGRDHVLRHLRSLYVTDGTSLWVTVAVERLPATPYLLAGFPYAATTATACAGRWWDR